MKAILVAGALVICVTVVLARQGAIGQNSPFESVPSAPIVSDSLTFSSIIPAFHAVDINGKQWRSSDFKGKVTVVSIWGVYCPPCRAEQPVLQDFYDRTRATKTLQVITFCLDDKPDRVRSYMMKTGYTFPVIVNDSLETKLFPIEGGIPKTFVIGPTGRRTERFKSWTFGRVLLEVDKIAKTM